MERRLYPLSYLHQEQLRNELGFSTTHNPTMDNAVNPGDYIELLDSYGKIRRVLITQRIPRPVHLDDNGIEYFDIIYAGEDGREFVANTSMSDLYDIGWRFATPVPEVDNPNF